LWRRLIASVYDGLLLVALWMGAALIEVMIRDQLLGLPSYHAWLQVYFFTIGLGFFGWFWTHGGQTLGMRSWRLKVQRLDGSTLRWPIASLRYTVMLASWALVLTPAILHLPRLSAYPHALETGIGALAVTAVSVTIMLIDKRRRAPCDFLSGTEVQVLPRPGSAT
jgi:uncharacterized RDD family membrane protein YckC